MQAKSEETAVNNTLNNANNGISTVTKEEG